MDKSFIPHQCIYVINEADIVENKIEIKRKKKKIKKNKIIFDIWKKIKNLILNYGEKKGFFIKIFFKYHVFLAAYLSQLEIY